MNNASKMVCVLALCLACIFPAVALTQSANMDSNAAGSGATGTQLVVQVGAADGNLNQKADVDSSVSGNGGTSNLNSQVMQIGAASGTLKQDADISSTSKGFGTSIMNDDVYQAGTGKKVYQDADIRENSAAKDTSITNAAITQYADAQKVASQDANMETYGKAKNVGSTQTAYQTASGKYVDQDIYGSANLPGEYVASSQLGKQVGYGKGCESVVDQDLKFKANSDPRSVTIAQGGIQNANGHNTYQDATLQATAGGNRVAIGQAIGQETHATHDASQRATTDAWVWWADSATVGQGTSQNMYAGNNGYQSASSSMRDPAKESTDTQVTLQNIRANGKYGTQVAYDSINVPSSKTTSNTQWIDQDLNGGKHTNGLQIGSEYMDTHASGKNTGTQVVDQYGRVGGKLTQSSNQKSKAFGNPVSTNQKAYQTGIEY